MPGSTGLCSAPDAPAILGEQDLVLPSRLGPAARAVNPRAAACTRWSTVRESNPRPTSVPFERGLLFAPATFAKGFRGPVPNPDSADTNTLYQLELTVHRNSSTRP